MSRQQPIVPLRALVIISVVALAVLLLASTGLATGGDEVTATVSYQVQAGDTLWSIAGVHAGSGDLHSAVHDIRSLNGLAGSLIHAGQVLELPVPTG